MYTICCGSASLLFIVSYNKSFQARNSVSGNGTSIKNPGDVITIEYLDKSKEKRKISMTLESN